MDELNNPSQLDLDLATARVWNLLLDDDDGETDKTCEQELFDSRNYVSRMRTLVFNSHLDKSSSRDNDNDVELDKNMNEILDGLDRFVKTNTQLASYKSENDEILERLIREDALAASSGHVPEVLEISDIEIESVGVKNPESTKIPEKVVEIRDEKPKEEPNISETKPPINSSIYFLNIKT